MTVFELLSPRPNHQESPAPSSPQDASSRTHLESESEEEKHVEDGCDEESDEVQEKEKDCDVVQEKKVYRTQGYMNKIQQIRNLSGKIVNDSTIQFLVILLISVNAIMMGIATFPFVKDDPRIYRAFELTDKIFLIAFTIELAMQLIYHGFRLFLDGWLVFDFIIIVVSWSFAELQIVRAFRIFRALRLITRVKVLKNLLTALFSVVPQMGAISLLLFLIFFIFAILMTSLWKDLYQDNETSQDYFSRLDATFFTLFQIMTLDNWAGISREVMAVQSWAWVPFIAFVLISGFIVVNLIIAVICEAIGALHSDDRAKLVGQSGSGKEDKEPVQVDVKQHLQALERQVEELTRMQQQTMHTLQYMTRHLQSKRMGAETTAKKWWL
jgi:hypothetical protein